MNHMRNYLVIAILAIANQAFAAAEVCSEVPNSQTCIDATPCKQSSTGETVCLSGYQTTGALMVPNTCWQYSKKYACAYQSVNTCSDLESNPACSVVASRCVNTIAETGRCANYANTFSCKTAEAQTEQTLSCQTPGLSASLIPNPENKNQTFIQASLAMEIVRQSATYGQNGANLFGGVSETCKEGYAGIKSCCGSKPGAQSNSAVTKLAFQVGGSAVKYAGQKAVDIASPYVFDAMYAGSTYAMGLTSSMGMFDSAASLFDFTSTIPSGTNFAGSPLSAYGFTYSTTASAAGTGLMGANTTLYSSATGDAFITFNPYVFAAMVAVQVIQDLASCSNEEQMLALHKGANLSIQVDEWCSNKIPLIGTCIESTKRYCSFNSVLARIINTQAKPQLGRSITDCSGLSVEDMTKIDFTRVDFTEFTGQIVQQATANAPANMKGNYTPLVQQMTSGASQGKSSVIPTYPK